jgi:hypothetical protein
VSNCHTLPPGFEFGQKTQKDITYRYKIGFDISNTLMTARGDG